MKQERSQRNQLGVCDQSYAEKNELVSASGICCCWCVDQVSARTRRQFCRSPVCQVAHWNKPWNQCVYHGHLLTFHQQKSDSDHGVKEMVNVKKQVQLWWLCIFFFFFFLTWQRDKRNEEGRQNNVITDYRKRIFIYSSMLYSKGIKVSRSQESNTWKQKDWPTTTTTRCMYSAL